MDMLGNTKMREAILRYYQESGDPGAVCKAIKAAGDSDDVTDSNMGHLFNAWFGMKGYVIIWVFLCNTLYTINLVHEHTDTQHLHIAHTLRK